MKCFFKKWALAIILANISTVMHLGAYCDEDQECFSATCANQYHQVIPGWYFHTATLWWKATEDGLALGQEVKISRRDEIPGTLNYEFVKKHSKEKTPNFQYNSGFRLGVLYSSEKNCLNAFFDWTHYDTRASVRGESCIDSSNPPDNTYKAFQPFWESLARNFPDRSKAHWTLHLDLFDLAVGHSFYIWGTRFSLRPFFGLRLADVRQKFHVHSENDQGGIFNGASYVYDSEVKAHSDFFGVGPRLGCYADLKLHGGFCIFGQAAGSLVYGKFNSHSREFFRNFDDYYYKFDHFKDHSRKNNRDFTTRAITDMAIGVRYGDNFNICSKSIPIYIAVSWEHHAFWDFNRFNFKSDGFTNANHENFDFGPYTNVLPSPKKCGDLFTQGLTVEVNFGF